MNDYVYVGEELDLFAHAVNWKAYVRSQLAPYIQGNVLEVGAGIGATTRMLCDGRQASWTCLEPDASLVERLRAAVDVESMGCPVEVLTGTLDALDAGRRFDCILYIDVLEHIEDDRGEVRRAASFLKPGGRLVILCPAHNFLFTEFDRAIGHFRRYDAGMFRAIRPDELEMTELFYLDACGMTLSLANRMLLRSGSPTHSQIQLWDRLFVPCSRWVDWLIGRRLGKSVVAVMTRPAG